MNKLLVGWRPYAIAVVVLCALAALVLAVQSDDDRFGDPAVLEQIHTSTDCDELRDRAYAVLTTDPKDKAAYDRAVGYSNAAYDRMDALGC